MFKLIKGARVFSPEDQRVETLRAGGEAKTPGRLWRETDAGFSGRSDPP
jgi:hypothetical protein